MVLLRVKVTPKARSNSIVGWEGDRLKVRLRANPEKGEANEMLVEFLAELLGVRRSAIRLVKGHASRLKDLEIDGMGLDAIASLLTT